MAGTDIVARLKLRAEEYTAEMAKTFTLTEVAAKRSAAAIGNTFSSIKSVAAGAVLGVGVGELTALGKRALDYASSLGEVSQQLGVTTTDLQVYRYAASQVGIEQETMDKGLAKLTQTLGKAALGAKGPQQAFAALGIDVRDAEGHVRTAGETIPLVADALAKVTDPAQRAAAEVALFGKAGQQLDTLLAGGKGQINELANAARRLGLVLSSEQIQHADDAADKLSAVKQVLEARIAGVVADNAQSIVKLADALGNLVTKAPAAFAAMSKLPQYAKLAQSGLDVAEGFFEPGGRYQRGLAGVRAARLEIDRLDNVGKASFAAGSLASLDARAAKLKRPAATGENLPTFLGSDAAASKTKAKTAVDERAAKAIRDAEEANRKLGQSLDDIVKKYDPARVAAAAYADELKVLADGAAKGKITARDALGFSLKAGDSYQADRDDAAQRQVEVTFKSLGVDPLKADISAITNFADSRMTDLMKGAGQAGGEAFAKSGTEAVQAIAQTLGVKASSVLGKALGGLTGLQTGNFAGLNSPAGGVLSLLSGSAGTGKGSPFQIGLAETFAPLKDGLKGLVDGLGGNTFDQIKVGKAAGGAAIGSATGQLVGLLGARGSATGGAIGGALGGLTPLGPLGAAIGGAVGSAVLGAFKSVKKGSATIGFTGDDLGIVSTTGNSAAFKAAASGAAGSVVDGLKRVADALGGSLSGTVSTSIGVRHGDFRVDASGLGITKVKKGAIDFDQNSEAAIRYAISDALQDGVIAGISDATKRILASGQDLEAAITKATFIESIPKQLRAITDPLGAALDDLDAKWKTQVATLTEAGASLDQMAAAEKLYRLQVDQVKQSVAGAADTFKAFADSLGIGAASPLSLRDQEAAARAAVQPFLDQIDAGSTVDQAKYVAAAQSFLDVERQLKGSTAEYFAEFDRIQAATAKGIATVDNAQPIRTAADPFAEATAKATQASAEIASDQLVTLGTLAAKMDDLIRVVAGGSAGGFIGTARNFV